MTDRTSKREGDNARDGWERLMISVPGDSQPQIGQAKATTHFKGKWSWSLFFRDLEWRALVRRRQGWQSFRSRAARPPARSRAACAVDPASAPPTILLLRSSDRDYGPCMKCARSNRATVETRNRHCGATSMRFINLRGSRDLEAALQEMVYSDKPIEAFKARNLLALVRYLTAQGPASDICGHLRFQELWLSPYHVASDVLVRVSVDWFDYAPLRDGFPEAHYRFQIHRGQRVVSRDARAFFTAEAEQVICDAFGWSLS